jgi:L,D-peptidoglycan transpeptidase YkuD (ErfK/YbiS/YcfS/YnhG family)
MPPQDTLLHRITVRPSAKAIHRGVLVAGHAQFDCALGTAGVTITKQEGDGATPIGRFPVRRGLYRDDRLACPTTPLPMQAIQRLDGWSDDIADPDYNQQVTHPTAGTRPFSAEHLWREDHIYDLILVIGHNDSPPVPGAGSAIFMHVARDDFSGTEGCVALRQADLLTLLPSIGPKTILSIEDWASS